MVAQVTVDSVSNESAMVPNRPADNTEAFRSTSRRGRRRGISQHKAAIHLNWLFLALEKSRGRHHGRLGVTVIVLPLRSKAASGHRASAARRRGTKLPFQLLIEDMLTRWLALDERIAAFDAEFSRG
jgi:hypothetical protein